MKAIASACKILVILVMAGCGDSANDGKTIRVHKNEAKTMEKMTTDEGRFARDTEEKLARVEIASSDPSGSDNASSSNSATDGQLFGLGLIVGAVSSNLLFTKPEPPVRIAEAEIREVQTLLEALGYAGAKKSYEELQRLLRNVSSYPRADVRLKLLLEFRRPIVAFLRERYGRRGTAVYDLGLNAVGLLVMMRKYERVGLSDFSIHQDPMRKVIDLACAPEDVIGSVELVTSSDLKKVDGRDRARIELKRIARRYGQDLPKIILDTGDH